MVVNMYWKDRKSNLALLFYFGRRARQDPTPIPVVDMYGGVGNRGGSSECT